MPVTAISAFLPTLLAQRMLSRDGLGGAVMLLVATLIE
jgi:hypothetical protein